VVSVQVNIPVVTFGVPRRALFVTFSRVLLIAAPVDVHETSSTVSNQSEIADGVATTLDVVSIEVNRSPRLLIPPGVSCDSSLGVPVLLTHVFVCELITSRSVEVERTERTCLAIDLVTVQIHRVPPAPVVRARPLLEMLGLPWLTASVRSVVKLPTVVGKVTPDTLLTLGNAVSRGAVVREPDAIAVFFTLVPTLLHADVPDTSSNVPTRAIALPFDVVTRDLFVVELVPIPVVAHRQGFAAVRGAVRAFQPAVPVWMPRDADAVICRVAHAFALFEIGTPGVFEITADSVPVSDSKIVRVGLRVFFPKSPPRDQNKK